MIQGLPESGYTRVYRKLVAHLKTDPVLETLSIEWIAWDGTTKNIRPIGHVRKPTIVLFPSLGAMDWSSVDAQSGDLEINIAMYVPNTLDACDCLDLWMAMAQAIYPFNDAGRQRALRKKLKGDGCGTPGGQCDATTGEVKFVRPPTIQQRLDNQDQFSQFECFGAMSIAVRRVINP